MINKSIKPTIEMWLMWWSGVLPNNITKSILHCTMNYFEACEIFQILSDSKPCWM